MKKEIKLRGNKPRIKFPWSLGDFPEKVIKLLARQLVHRIAIGCSDITGDDFGTIYANAIEGEHRQKPLGLADVILEGNAWSVKTVKDKKPFEKKVIRLISGRNSPAYSVGISDPQADIQETGSAVLNIWNARLHETLNSHDSLRSVALIRNIESKEFVIFEENVEEYNVQNYEWRKNTKNNLEGYEIKSGIHKFTWQPHGSQFTVKKDVPAYAKKFKIVTNNTIVSEEKILEAIGYTDDWIQLI